MLRRREKGHAPKIITRMAATDLCNSALKASTWTKHYQARLMQISEQIWCWPDLPLGLSESEPGHPRLMAGLSKVSARPIRGKCPCACSNPPVSLYHVTSGALARRVQGSCQTRPRLAPGLSEVTGRACSSAPRSACIMASKNTSPAL